MLTALFSGTYAVLDSEDTVIMVLVGKPVKMSSRKSRLWDEQAARFASKVESMRARDERPFAGKAGHHSRGDFGSVTFGIGYGGGRKVYELPYSLVNVTYGLS